MNPTSILECPHVPFAGYPVAKLPKNRIPSLIGEPLAIGLKDTSSVLPYGIVKAMQRSPAIFHIGATEKLKSVNDFHARQVLLQPSGRGLRLVIRNFVCKFLQLLCSKQSL